VEIEHICHMICTWQQENQGPVSRSDRYDKWQVAWWGSDKWQVILNPFSRNTLLDFARPHKTKEMWEVEGSDWAFLVTGLVVAVLLRHSVAGADPDFGGLKLMQFLGPSIRKRVQNYECRMKCETD
jgi:hypothetical protein